MDTYQSFSRKKIIHPDKIVDLVDQLRRENKSIATLNGSFDLLHSGHLHILYEASKMADVLIVATNSDASIKAYKSIHRPICSLSQRMDMLAAIFCIGYVTWFEELNPINILSKIKPDVHVNGEEYGYNCIEADTVKKNGGRIHIVNHVPGLSTSNIVDKIRKLGDK